MLEASIFGKANSDWCCIMHSYHLPQILLQILAEYYLQYSTVDISNSEKISINISYSTFNYKISFVVRTYVYDAL